MGGQPWRLVAAGVTLRDQVNERWPDRDKASDGSIGDAAHAARPSDHNPDADGWVHAIDIDKDGIDADALADQLIALARARKDGGRLKNIVWRGRVASGTYPATFWTWRDRPDLGHYSHIHISFTSAAQRDGSPFPLDILEADVPLSDDDVKRIADAVWNRFITTAYQPDGSVDPANPQKVRAGAMLAGTRGTVLGLANQPGPDGKAVAEAVADEIAGRLAD